MSDPFGSKSTEDDRHPWDKVQAPGNEKQIGNKSAPEVVTEFSLGQRKAPKTAGDIWKDVQKAMESMIPR